LNGASLPELSKKSTPFHFLQQRKVDKTLGRSFPRLRVLFSKLVGEGRRGALVFALKVF